MKDLIVILPPVSDLAQYLFLSKNKLENNQNHVKKSHTDFFSNSNNV
jgi:hypothetical protein